MVAWRMAGRLGPVGVLLLAALAVHAPRAGFAQDADRGLRKQIGDLARAEGIVVTGLHLIGAAPARSGVAGGALDRRLRVLLGGFNFIVFHDSAGHVSRVRVLGESRAGPPRMAETTVPAIRQGTHYLVDAVLIGPTGLWLNRRLVVDTGASTVVLPVSAIPGLGLRESDLTLGTVETAGGTVPARHGRLAAVQIGHARVEDVQVTFIADERLGQTALLGMSFLDRFQITFDDTARRILLIAK